MLPSLFNMTELSQRGVSVKDAPYNAKGNGIVLQDGVMSAGSYTLQSSSATFTSADVGKTIAVSNAGSLGSFTISAATNATPIQITFTGTSSIGVFSGLEVIISGVLGNTNANGISYLNNVAGTNPVTAQLYTDSQLQTKRAGNGTYISGGTGIAPGTLTTTIASVTDSKHVVLASPCVNASGVSGVQFTYGTDDTTAINTALATGGLIYLPPGIYCSNANTAPCFSITVSGTQLYGAGRGVSTLVNMFDYNAALYINATGGSSGSVLSDILVKDLSTTCGGTQFQRYVQTFGIYALGTATQTAGVPTTKIQYLTLENCEAYNTQLGIQVRDAIYDSQIRGCYSHNTVADGISVWSTVSPCFRVSIIGNMVLNSGDDAISNNSYLTSSGANHGVVTANNTVLNSGGGGIATVGCDGYTIANNIIQNTYLAGIRGYAGNGFYGCNALIITGNQVTGAGNGTRGPAAYSDYAAILLLAVGSSSFNYVSIIDNLVAPDLGTDSMGVAIGVYNVNGTGNTCNYVQISNNRLIGPFLAVTDTTYRINVSSLYPGIFVNNGTNFSLTGNLIYKSYGEGILVGSGVGGNLTVANNVIDTPNTHATAGYYAIDLQGGKPLYVENNSIVNIGTLAAVYNINPSQTATVTNTFSAFTNGASVVGKTTTTGSLTWAAATGSSGTATTNTAAPNLDATSLTPTVLLNISSRDCVLATAFGASGQPTAANQVLQVLACDGTINNFIGVDLYNGSIYQVVGGTQTTLATCGYTASASDTVTVILAGNKISVYTTHGSAYAISNEAFAPLSLSGTNVGFQFKATGVGVASFSVK